MYTVVSEVSYFVVYPVYDPRALLYRLNVWVDDDEGFGKRKNHRKFNFRDKHGYLLWGRNNDKN